MYSLIFPDVVCTRIYMIKVVCTRIYIIKETHEGLCGLNEIL